MPEFPQKKIGIVACSGEEMAEGTVSRMAALKLMERLRPDETVTICLPLFLAGGEGDRAFAKFYPTITIDGCDKRCAYRGTEMYSNRPAGSIVVTELAARNHLGNPEGKRKLNAPGLQIVDAVADEAADQVDVLLGKSWNRREGKFSQDDINKENNDEGVTTCACGSGIPVQKINVQGKELTLVALPVIFKNFYDAKKLPSDTVIQGMLEMIKIYNDIQQVDDKALGEEINRQYQSFLQNLEAIW
jgi:hypothetical protein